MDYFGLRSIEDLPQLKEFQVPAEEIGEPSALEEVVSFELPQPENDRHGQLCLLYTSPSPRDRTRSRMPSSA